MIGYLNQVIRPIVLIMSKMVGHVKTYVKASFGADDEKLLAKYIAIWTKAEDLKLIELITLPFWDNRYR